VRVRLSVIVCMLIASASLIAWQNLPSNVSSSNRLLYTVASDYNPLAWLQGEERFPNGATVFLEDNHIRKPLVSGFFATADANVSFDGVKVLFAGKHQARDHWQVWEISSTNGKLRQITHCADDCVRPLYVPPDHFVYAQKVAGKFVLETASLEGKNNSVLQLTYGAGNFLPSDVLRDGRILYQAAYIQDGKTIAELYTVYSDGSGVEAYRCDHQYARYAGKQISSDDVIFARDGGLFRFTSALAHDVPVNAPTGNYAGDVIEAPDGSWLVGWRNSASTNFELRKWRPGTGILEPQIADPSTNVIQPVWLASRPMPNRFPSALHDWSYANVLCLNSYTSKYQFKNGSIASIRLHTRDAQGKTQVLGTTSVEKDGSFYLRVPGDRPLQIELLDSSGNTLKKEAGWFWMRKGEQRVCVGCHAGPETAPENAGPEVLRRSVIPVDMTGNGGHATPGGH
jgi:Hydrazine synthase alpha subunit middle domain